VQIATHSTASEFRGGIIGVTVRPVSGANFVSPITGELMSKCTATLKCPKSSQCREDEQKEALKKAAGVSGGNDQCQVRLKGREHDYWMHTEIGISFPSSAKR